MYERVDQKFVPVWLIFGENERVLICLAFIQLVYKLLESSVSSHSIFTNSLIINLIRLVIICYSVIHRFVQFHNNRAGVCPITAIFLPSVASR